MTSSRTFLIFLMTYFIGLGELSHVIAGSTETFYLVCVGEASLVDYGLHFLLPVGLGNVVAAPCWSRSSVTRRSQPTAPSGGVRRPAWRRARGSATLCSS